MTLEIRPVQPRDYAAVTALHNADNEPHFYTEAAELERRDALNTDGGRTVAVLDGQVIGTAEFWLWREGSAYRIGVHTNDATAAARLLVDLEARATRASRLLATVRADFLGRAHHLQHGFEEVFRSFGANSNLAEFDPSTFAGLEPALLERGIRVFPRVEWHAPDGNAQLEAIQREANADVPGYAPVVPSSADFKHRRLLEAFWVAVRDQTCVGFCTLDGTPQRGVVQLDASGVARTERRQGIGLALAARAVAWAKAHGWLEVNDGGAKANTAQIRILERLRFEFEPDWVTFKKRLGAQRSTP